MAAAILAIDGVPWVSAGLLLSGLAVLAVVLIQTGRSQGWSALLGPGRVKPIAPPPALPRNAPQPAPTADSTGEVEELVRQLAAELDERAARLERLIAAADDRLARLERPDRAPTRRPTEDPDDGTDRARPRLMVQEGDPVTRRIYTLADEGLPAVEIARRVEQPTGKIELILALRGR